MSEARVETYGGVFRGADVLVTGGAGFIGSHLSRRLAELGANVRVLDDLSSGHESNLADEGGPGAIELVRASILDPDELERSIRACRFVFHQAAMVSVPESVASPGRCMEINVVGTERVLTAARQAGVQRVVFAASAAAYGNTPSLPSKEMDPPDCCSPYAASKVAGELLMQAYARCYGLSTISLRYFNVFGPRQDPRSAYAAAMAAFAEAVIAGGRPKIFGDGQQTRDFVSVENIVHANLLAASCERSLKGEVVNIGGGGRIRLLDALREIGSAMGVRIEPEFYPPRAGDVRDSSADVSRARALLGYREVVAFREGVRRMMEWVKARTGLPGERVS